MTDPWYNETTVVLVMIAITVFFLTHTFGRQTRREMAVTTGGLVPMVGVAWVFFLVADRMMRRVVTFVLSVGS